MKNNQSEKSKLMALILCIFFGAWGFHRFYVGKNNTGLLYFLTLGLLGFGTIYDGIKLATDNFTDSEGKKVTLMEIK
jgi:TM2 domain-containing membrane protein YozV